MRWTHLGLTLAAAVVVALCFAPASPAADDYYRQSIKNTSGETANDLHIVFTNDVAEHEVKVRPATQPPGHDGDGAVPSSNHRAADFAPPDTFGTVGAGGVAYLDYGYYGYAPYVDDAESYFTKDNQRLPGFERTGLPMAITQEQFDKPTATITNSLIVAQQYYVTLYRDNALPNLMIDTYFIPTGIQVPGTPTTFVLEPGQSRSLEFGVPLPDRYLLALCEGWPVGAPGNSYLLYSAATVVPEPAALSLLALGGLGALLRRKRR